MGPCLGAILLLALAVQDSCLALSLHCWEPGLGTASLPQGSEQLQAASVTELWPCPCSLLEESYVMKDPFSPDRDRFLVLGARCSICGRLVCVGPVSKQSWVTALAVGTWLSWLQGGGGAGPSRASESWPKRLPRWS